MTPQQYDFSNSRPITAEAASSFVTRVYNWMGIGLGVTALVALVTANTPALVSLIFGNPIVVIVLILAQLGMAMGVGAAARRANPGLATMLFLVYAGMLGLTLSAVLIIYTAPSIAATFFVTAGMFGGMSLYGWTTKRDLTSIGSFCLMALLGLILASIVNFFLRSDALGWMLSIAGVAIFVGLTAYDTQKIKRIAAVVDADSAHGKGLAIQGALALYLDFVNLFLFLLRLFGRRR